MKYSDQILYPRVEYDIIDDQVSNSKIDLWINCGNLYLRKDVSLWDDIEFGIKNLEPLIDEYKQKYQDKLTEFVFEMSYDVPDPVQIKLLDDKKFEEYENIDGTIHYFNPIEYKNDTLYVSTDIFSTNYKIIASVANLIKGLKIICFTIGRPEGYYLDGLDIEDDEYIEKTLNNKKWSRWFLTCNERYTDDGEYGNDLDIIKELRSLINKDISLDFESFDDQIPFIKKKVL